MARVITTKTQEVTTQTVERSFEIVITSRRGEPVTITARRELVELANQTELKQLDTSLTTKRLLAEVAGEEIAIAGTKGPHVSLEALFMALDIQTDVWAEEDENAHAKAYAEKITDEDTEHEARNRKGILRRGKI